MIKDFKNRLLTLTLLLALGLSVNAEEYVTPNVTINPASGSTVTTLDKIEFTYTDTSMIMFTDYVNNYATITKNGETVGTYTLKDTKGVNNQIYIEPNISEPGEYTVNIRAGLVQAALTGTLYGEVNATYTIAETTSTLQYKYEVTPDAAQQVTNLSTIKTRIYATDANGNEMEGITYTVSTETVPNLYFTTDGNDVLITGSTAVDESANGSFIWSSTNGITESGSYKFVVPAGYMTMKASDGTSISNDRIEVIYTYKNGSESATMTEMDGSGPVIIYSVDGKVIKYNADSSDIENLKKGIYIINGKKRMVSK